MGRKSKHHFIPKSYLKRFTEGGEDYSQFWCVPINNDSPFVTSPNDACAKRDYYSVDYKDSLLVENWYGNEIEPKINIVLKHIDKYKSLPSTDDMQYLLLLIATLYLRTPSFRDQLEVPLKRTKEIVESMSKDIKIANLDDFNYTKTDLIGFEVRLLKSMINSLRNKYYRLYTIGDSQNEVITSDCPFLLSHPKGGKNFYFGLDTPNIEICVPITRKSILIGSNEPCEEGTYPAIDRLIGLTNTQLILMAKKYFYTNKTEISLVDDDFNLYSHKISSNKRLKSDHNRR